VKKPSGRRRALPDSDAEREKTAAYAANNAPDLPQISSGSLDNRSSSPFPDTPYDPPPFSLPQAFRKPGPVQPAFLLPSCRSSFWASAPVLVNRNPFDL